MAPITADGRLWGALAVFSASADHFPLMRSNVWPTSRASSHSHSRAQRRTTS